MASVVSNSTHDRGGKNFKRGVHFDCCINWAEEGRRSNRGAYARQNRKDRKRLRMAQEDVVRKEVLTIIRDQQYETKLEELSRSDVVFRYNFRPFLAGGEDQATTGILDLLQAFRNNADKSTVEQLSAVELGFLNVIKGNDGFREKFREMLPASVLTDSSSADSTPDRDEAKRKRNEKPNSENMGKKINRIVGGRIPFVPAQAHIPDDEDAKDDS